MGRCRNFFSKLNPNALIRCHNSGLEIKNIMERKAGYGITALTDDRGERRDFDEAIARRRAPAFHASNSSHVVLMEGEKEAILHLLDPKREKRRSAVSFVGMGGLGKTTLAMKVFKDPRLQNRSRFGCAFWINISQDYKDVKLLRDLLRQISQGEIEEYDKMENTMLESRLHDLLVGKTYLIVMDDVWTPKSGGSLGSISQMKAMDARCSSLRASLRLREAQA